MKETKVPIFIRFCFVFFVLVCLFSMGCLQTLTAAFLTQKYVKVYLYSYKPVKTSEIYDIFWIGIRTFLSAWHIKFKTCNHVLSYPFKMNYTTTATKQSSTCVNHHAVWINLKLLGVLSEKETLKEVKYWFPFVRDSVRLLDGSIKKCKPPRVWNISR